LQQYGCQPVKTIELNDYVEQLLDPNATLDGGILKYSRQRTARWLVQHKARELEGIG